ncbi:MAG: LysR family transcriptional regulator [Eubacteriales bacterium]
MNNIQHLKYAVEVEKTGSISKAAKNLFMGQPQLSKAIKELEDSLGISVFNRTPQGVVPTVKGTEFLRYAKSILAQIEEMESLYKQTDETVHRFDISVPRASYISYAFSEFAGTLESEKEIDLNYRETNSMRAIRNVADNINNIAVIRYQEIYEKYFISALEERDLEYLPIWEFNYLVLMSDKHPLAGSDIIKYSDLRKYTEIIHGDITIPALPLSEARQIEKADDRKKKIAVYERGSQLELLSRLSSTYMWVSPMPRDVLDCFSLVQRECNMSKNRFKDILIYRKGYRFSAEENLFIEILKKTVETVSSR